jgi:uncharacterized protein
MITPALIHRIVQHYRLPLGGLHGLSHWARVLEIGVRLAEDSGANVEVVQLFAVFHDARRINEGWDDGHGRRGAELAARLRGEYFDLDDDAFEMLYTACVEHTDGRTDGDVTTQTCWDADRLDLPRVGLDVDRQFLGTDAARQRDVIRWAHGRAALRYVPEIIADAWELPLDEWPEHESFA